MEVGARVQDEVERGVKRGVTADVKTEVERAVEWVGTARSGCVALGLLLVELLRLEEDVEREDEPDGGLVCGRADGSDED